MVFALSASHPLIMGIINVTPDSFSGDGLMTHGDPVDAAVTQALSMVAEGADLVDIGGESSRPGAVPVSAEDEMRRVVPAVRAMRKVLPSSCIIAVDTVKAAVAEAALDAGAAMINDISALRNDPAMAALAARRKVPVVLMHNASKAQAVTHDARVGSSYDAVTDDDIVATVMRDLQKRIDAARQAGIADASIILDPGLGFGKSVMQNLTLIRHVERIKSLGFPVLVGPSRKSFVGKLLDLPIGNRLEGTAALVSVATFCRADIIRVHDVGFMARVAHAAAAVRDAA
jgi:dihydropteroate synthase